MAMDLNEERELTRKLNAAEARVEHLEEVIESNNKRHDAYITQLHEEIKEGERSIDELVESSMKDDQIIALYKELLALTTKYYETREPKHICRCNSRSRTNTE